MAHYFRGMGIKVIITGATGYVGEGVLLECLKSLQVEAVPHGFRSTFRTWCSPLNFPTFHPWRRGSITPC